MLSIFRRLMKNEKGATAIEYTLIASLIAVAAIVAMRSIGTKINGVMAKRRQRDELNRASRGFSTSCFLPASGVPSPGRTAPEPPMDRAAQPGGAEWASLGFGRFRQVSA